MTLQEIDPKLLKNSQHKFVVLSQSRLSRMLNAFNMEQADCIKLIPLLFHVNHPMLPGYVNKKTPCGIPDYFPSTVEKNIAKTISRSFKFQSRAYLKFEIAGLYLMGSTGTLAQSVHSDLDLWVCLSDKLTEWAENDLRKKTALISRWMDSRGIELNCYLVQQDEFETSSQKNLEADSCGNTQNYLLLDEFYRTAVWIAGRMPLWWIVPPGENYKAFVGRLVGDKHINAIDWIDLGDITEIPAAEYFSAALWQLFKSTDSPYKSSLKLLVLEIYARCFPQTGMLSAKYKQLVYEGESELDPYLIVLQYAEKFLENNPQRLEFLRRAFYLKAGSKIQLNKNKPRNWRYQQLKKLVNRWGWNQARLDYLNSRNQWQVNSVIKERVDLVRELNHSYHFISNFARVQGVLDAVSQKELLSLGRMLYAAFERRSGKIEMVNHGIVKSLTEHAVTLSEKTELTNQGRPKKQSQNRGVETSGSTVQHNNKSSWRLYLGMISPSQVAINKTAYTAESFFEVLVWCVCNQVVNANTNFKIYSQNKFYSDSVSRQMVKDIQSLVVTQKAVLGSEAYNQPAKIVEMGIFLNTVNDPLLREKNSNIYSVINQSDGFCWGENRLNLFAQFHLVSVNSWGEYSCKSYSGEDAWIQFFIEHKAILQKMENDLQFYGPGLPGLLEHKRRLSELLDSWQKLMRKSIRQNKAVRYLMSVDKAYLRIDFSGERIQHKIFRQSKRLLNSLTDQVEMDISLYPAENLDLPVIVTKLLKKAATSVHQCYFLQTGRLRYSTYITSPDGYLYYQEHQGAELSHLVDHYQQFFDSLANRLAPEILENNTSIEVNFWVASVESSHKNRRFKKIKSNQYPVSMQYQSVQAIATFNSEQKICFNLFVGEQAYFYRDYGELVYTQLARYMVKHRAKESRYPIFMSDIDLSGVANDLSSIKILEYKRTIEQKLLLCLNRIEQKAAN